MSPEKMVEGWSRYLSAADRAMFASLGIDPDPVPEVGTLLPIVGVEDSED
jgi:hypothetical protein